MTKVVTVLAAALLALVGCTPTQPTPQPSTPSTSASGTPASPSATPVAPGERYDLPADRDVAQWGTPIASKVGKKLSDPRLITSREGWRVDLMGVYRLASDRVLVEFRLNADDAVRPDLKVWNDPDYDWWFHPNDPKNAGYTGTVWEFSDVQLKVAGDDTSYRAVRTASHYCLCTMSTENVKGYGDYPAYVVLTTPKDASSVSLSLRDVGTFADVAVTTTPPVRSVVPLGFGYQLRLLAVSRPVPGTVHVRFSLELPAGGIEGTTFRPRYMYQVGGAAPWKELVDSSSSYQNLIALDPGGVDGGWPKTSSQGKCDSCTVTEGYLSKPGTAMDLEMDLPDPGTPTVLVTPTVGWPFSAVPTEGTPSAGSGLVHYRPQSKTTGADISDGDFNLDTAVLFAVDKATLTSRASATLDKVATALKAQSGRALVIVGHTDSTGSNAHNLDLSRRRAAAVKAALEQRLGDGWTYTTRGVGEGDPRVRESGLSGAQLERARALNRRVEVSVK